MTVATLRPEQRTERRLTLEGIPVRLTTFKLGQVYLSALDNVDPGATLVRIEASTKKEAEDRAIEEARREILANAKH